ncbi:hypothetical protein Acr_26g0005540 [Actinidia rufa]|uniref:Uncharacterized protein n=1 Tax=Actinidia rufa TaxID=165716 RepID=A0A7J0H3B5_9ERIC|nr:hypothetical protein Acr_26g0005540 [Actinidia rufa]
MVPAILTRPGFWLLSTEIAIADSKPAFTQSLHFTNIEHLRGYWVRVWQDQASTARSVLAAARPRVLSPGKSKAVIMAVDEWKKLSVLPARFSFEDLKSEAVTVAGFLQGKPFMKMGCRATVAVAVGHVSWRISPSNAHQRLMEVKKQAGKTKQKRI